MSAVIDCSLHALVGSLDELVPHLDPSWARRMTTSEFVLPQPVPHPGLDVEGRAVSGGRDPVAAAAALPAEVERAIIVPAQALATAGWLGHRASAIFCSAVNDHVRSVWIPVDDRFRFAIAVAPHDGELAAEEIRRLGSDPAAAAVCMPLVAVNMGQRHYHPIYEAASSLGLPLIVHPGGAEGTVLGPALLPGVGPRRPEENVTLLPQVALTNVASLIYDGVFERFPDLKVVFAGFGFDWAISALWRTDQEWRNLRTEVPWLDRTPTEYAASHIRFVVDGAARPLHADAWRLAEMLPPEVLLYGSDAPFSDEDVASVLSGAPESLRERIARENAVETFGARV